MSVSARMTHLLEDPKDRSASEAYALKMENVQERLKEVDALLVRHAEMQSKRPLNWGFSGDLDYTIEHLDKLIDHLK